jgi:hypothetical protein
VLALEVLRGQQVDGVVGLERYVFARANVAADDGDVAFLAATGGADGDIVARRQHAAAMGGARRGLGLFVFRMARSQAYANARPVPRNIIRGVFRGHGGRGRRHRRHPAALRLAHRFAHRLHGLDRIDHAAAHCQGEAVLRHLAGELAVGLVVARGDRHDSPRHVHVARGGEFGAGNLDRTTGIHRDVACNRTDRPSR